MDSDGSPQRSVQCKIHGVPLLSGCTALYKDKEVRNDVQERESPLCSAGGAAGCPP